MNAHLLPRLPPLRGKIENDPLSLPAAALDKGLVPHYDNESDSDISNHGGEEPVSTLFPFALSAAEQLNALFNIDKTLPLKNTSSTPSSITTSTNKTLDENAQNPITQNSNFDTKLFKRKRRIEVMKKTNNGIHQQQSSPDQIAEEPEILEDIPDESNSSPSENYNLPSTTKPISNPYSNFVKGSIEILDNSSQSRDDIIVLDKPVQKMESRQILQHKKNEINNVGKLMRDKLRFLSESTTPATSAQIMYIQFLVNIKNNEIHTMNKKSILFYIHINFRL